MTEYAARLELDVPRLLTDDVDVHFGFPRVVRAHNRDLLLFYRVGTTHAHDDAVIAMRRSADNGASWSEEEIIRTLDPGSSAHNPVALVCPDGRVILWTSQYEYGANLRHPCWWSSSADHGRTWHPFSIFDPSETHNCYYVTDAIVISDGLLASDATFPASGAGNCHTRIHHSSDDGATWTVRSLLTQPEENKGDEAGLAETVPGTTLCLHRDRGRTDIYRFWSHDGGRTWSPRESIRDVLDCVLQRPFLTPIRDGVLLLSGRDYKRKRVVAYLSTDGGHTFGRRLEVDTFQEDGAYTTVAPIGTDVCLFIWYSDSHTVPLKPDIKSAVLTVRGLPAA